MDNQSVVVQVPAEAEACICVTMSKLRPKLSLSHECLEGAGGGRGAEINH